MRCSYCPFLKDDDHGYYCRLKNDYIKTDEYTYGLMGIKIPNCRCSVDSDILTDLKEDIEDELENREKGV